jgi:O-antigen ligase
LKWLAFIVVSAAIIPLSMWLRRNPGQSPKVWVLVGFLPFVLLNLHFYIALDSWGGWSGYVQGAEVSLLDALALALYLSLPASRGSLPFRLSMALYFVAVLLSSLQAELPMAALLYSWQLARIFFVCAVVARGVAADPRVAPAILGGMAAALFVQAGFAVWERFGLGILQASGTVDHQNELGIMSHLVVFPFFALLLAGRRGWLPPAVVVAGLVIETFTGSRATLGLAGFGYAIVFAISAFRRWSSRKAAVLLVAVAAVALLTPVALGAFAQRGDANLEASDNERIVLESAAAAMLADHPWGIGANHFAFAANIGGYYNRAGLGWASHSAQVHNVYWLVAAETGYLGLVTLLFFLLRPLGVAFICSCRYRGDERGDLLLGLGVALLIVCIHSGFEWIWVSFEPQYLFALDVGLVGGVAMQLGYWSRQSSGAVRFPATTVSVDMMRNMR